MNKARWICLDAEAYRTRNPAMIEKVSAEAAEKEYSQNTKKELKAAWDTPEAIDARVQKAIDDTAKNPMLAEVLFIAVMDDAGHTERFDAMNNSINCTMRRFAEFLADIVDDKTVWTGFNILRYDLPLMLTEFRRQNIKPGDWFPKYYGRGWSGRIFDSIQRSPTLTPFVSLDDALMYHGITARVVEWQGEPMSGARVGAAFDAGEYNIIADYCATADVPNEDELYRSMSFNGEWGTYEDKDQSLREICIEISDSDMKDAHKWLALVPALRSAGLLDRTAERE
jgi:hypothetical protein